MVTRSREDPLPSSEAEIAQRAREGPSSEAEIGHPLEGDADGPHAGLRRVLPFPLNGKQAVGLRGLSRLIRCLCFFLKSGLSTTIRVSLIVAPDSSPRGFGRVMGFGQRVFRQFSPFDVIGRCCAPARRTWVPAQRT